MSQEHHAAHTMDAYSCAIRFRKETTMFKEVSFMLVKPTR